MSDLTMTLIPRDVLRDRLRMRVSIHLDYATKHKADENYLSENYQRGAAEALQRVIDEIADD